MPTPADARFYADLPPFESDDALTDERSYRAAPPDWVIFVTDVRGSTAAIAAGRYKEVNTLGAASIVSARNACPGVDFPFVFGGDGATLLVPAEVRAEVAEALLCLSRKARAGVGLDLRVGCVPVADVLARGRQVLVARRRLSEGNHIAMFAGGGLNEATAMVKQPDGAYLVSGDAAGSSNLDGLECRWCAVPARHDGVLSLIVHAPGESLPLYREMLAGLRDIAPQAMPITPANLPASWPPAFLMHESKLKRQGRLSQSLHYLGIAALTALLTVLVRLTRDTPGSAAATYIDSLCRNNDHLKLDDCLRMVIDVSHAQRARIESLLERYRLTHGAQWGTHFSASSIFTCMVRSPQDHLHFVDGNDGGYTAAARDMDARRAASI
ncbi:MAG: DUF3095 domain-containing protein [Burkholderiaceae bacterium]|nr:DUF3095 domain-containing protein [Burkholderiaceae bacterium]